MARQLLYRRGALVALTLVILVAAWSGRVDSLAQGHVETGLKRALITFATARTINAVVSTIQATNISVQPLGVGITFAPAQVLDPINDLVEQFSALMLLATISFGAQRLLIGVGGLPAVSALLSGLAIAWAAVAWRTGRSPPWLLRALVIFAFIRFAVPIAAIGSEMAYRYAMSSEYQATQDALGNTSRDLGGVAEFANQAMSFGSAAPAPKGHFWDKPAELMDRAKQDFEKAGAELKRFYETMRTQAEALVRHVIALMALFVVQTLILPVLFLWVTVRLLRASLGWSIALPGLDR